MTVASPKPLTLTRRIVRLDHGDGFTLVDARPHFPTEDAARAFLGSLVNDGLLLKPSRGRWKATPTGLRYQRTSRPLLHRTTADGMVEEFLRRVERVNRLKHLAFRVETVVLYGSYLSQKPMIGDVDVAVSFALRHADPDKQSALFMAAIDRSHHPTIAMRVTHPAREVMRELRGRLKIDLRSIFDLEELLEERRSEGKRIRTRVIYGRWRRPRRRHV